MEAIDWKRKFKKNLRTEPYFIHDNKNRDNIVKNLKIDISNRI